MKKALPVPVLVAAALVVVVVGWFAFAKMSEDGVQTGTKTGYGPNDMPPPPTFKIPPPPQDGAGGATGSVPPPAAVRPGG